MKTVNDAGISLYPDKRGETLHVCILSLMRAQGTLTKSEH